MLKVLLVDDEPNIRAGIKMIIPWEELGFEVCGEGENGEDGLKKIFELQPDLVLADVRMPGMTGIQLIEAAKNQGADCRFMIVSGYSDFTYAKEAISLGVEGFILKPIDEDELTENLKTVRDKILAEKERTIRENESGEYLREQKLRSILMGETNGENILSGCTSFDIALIEAIHPDYSNGQRNIVNEIKDFLGNTNDCDIVSAHLLTSIAVIFRNKPNGEAKDILKRFKQLHGGDIFITMGERTDDPSQIRNSYLSAEALMRDRFLYSDCELLTPEMRADTREEADLDSYADTIYAFIEINDTAKLKKCMDDFCSSLRKCGYSAERCKVACITLVMDINTKMIKNIGEKKTEQIFNCDLLRDKIGSCGGLFDIIELMQQTFTEISNVHFGKTTKSTMERVVRYIQANYNQELRLEMLAGIFGYNSAYLGKVFHQYTGENFNNYLDKIRITEAKRLLAMEEYKVYKVAEMVGYTNINYFHNKFKKYVGVSPLSYKKSCGKGGSESDSDENEE